MFLGRALGSEHCSLAHFRLLHPAQGGVRLGRVLCLLIWSKSVQHFVYIASSKVSNIRLCSLLWTSVFGRTACQCNSIPVRIPLRVSRTGIDWSGTCLLPSTTALWQSESARPPYCKTLRACVVYTTSAKKTGFTVLMLFGSDTLSNRHFLITAGLTVENGYVEVSSCCRFVSCLSRLFVMLLPSAAKLTRIANRNCIFLEMCWIGT